MWSLVRSFFLFSLPDGGALYHFYPLQTIEINIFVALRNVGFIDYSKGYILQNC